MSRSQKGFDPLKYEGYQEQSRHALSIAFRRSRFRGQEKHSRKRAADDESYQVHFAN
jgi:hypothetical protein